MSRFERFRFVEGGKARERDDQEAKRRKVYVRKRSDQRPSLGYADPSKYAHLPDDLNDIMSEDMILLGIGLNPGLMTATRGYFFANPGNLFWPLLYASGIIGEPMRAEHSRCIVDRWHVGLTNIVNRPTRSSSELSFDECVLGCHRTHEKLQALKIVPPAIVCFAKGIWEAFFCMIHGKKMSSSDKRAFAYGWQPDVLKIRTAGHDDPKCVRIFVIPGTSGRVTSHSIEERIEIARQLGDWTHHRIGVFASKP
ncbi:uracil DNA N-glycosylase Thp1 [Savitreella phatthalungensis]